MLYSARFVETLKVKANSLYNTRARERWAQCLLLSFSAAPSCLFPHAVLPYPPLRFALPAKPFLPYLQHHSALSATPFLLYPQRHLFLSPTPCCLIRQAILPYPPRHFTLSPTPFYLIRQVVLPYPPRHLTLIRHAILPYPPRHLTLSATPFFPSSPFDYRLQLLQTGHDGDKPQHAQMVLTALLPPL